jgi:carbon-monoxide dehydrogenase small subunit
LRNETQQIVSIYIWIDGHCPSTEIMKKDITLKINGDAYNLTVDTRMTLLEAIREKIGLTGTKDGCGVGECGTCTVLMDGKPIYSCLMLAVEADGKEILTIEGLATPEGLHPIQKAFIEHGAVQCGFCTPGMILSAKALLDENPNPTKEEIKEAISGNLCRCTGYQKIIEAIEEAGNRC